MRDGLFAYNPEMLQPRIVAQNDYLIVIDKPAGLIVHSDGRTEEYSVAEWILEKFPELKEVGEPWLSPQGLWYPRPGIVHRLDRTTSGIMIVAKTNEVFGYLKNEFKMRRVKKTYRAIVHGILPEDEGEICAELFRTKEVPKKWSAKAIPRDSSRAAITQWKVIARVPHGMSRTYVEVMPLTGRTHQIRVHFASIGHPLLSDHIYAAEREPFPGLNRPALHAHTISLSLPNGDQVTYESPIPMDLQNEAPDFRRNQGM